MSYNCGLVDCPVAPLPLWAFLLACSLCWLRKVIVPEKSKPTGTGTGASI